MLCSSDCALAAPAQNLCQPAAAVMPVFGCDQSWAQNATATLSSSGMLSLPSFTWCMNCQYSLTPGELTLGTLSSAGSRALPEDSTMAEEPEAPGEAATAEAATAEEAAPASASPRPRVEALQLPDEASPRARKGSNSTLKSPRPTRPSNTVSQPLLKMCSPRGRGLIWVFCNLPPAWRPPACRSPGLFLKLCHKAGPTVSCSAAAMAAAGSLM